MRAITNIAIILMIVSSTYAIKTDEGSTQGKLVFANLSNKLNKSHYGRALLGMVQMGSKMGFSYDDLWDTIDLLKTHLL